MKKRVFHWRILSPLLSCTYEWYEHSQTNLGQEIISNYDIHSNCPVELIYVLSILVIIAFMYIKQWKKVFSTEEYFCLQYHGHMNDTKTLTKILGQEIRERSYLTTIYKIGLICRNKKYR